MACAAERRLCDRFTAVLCVSPAFDFPFFIKGPGSIPEAGVAVPDARADASSKLPSPRNRQSRNARKYYLRDTCPPEYAQRQDLLSLRYPIFSLSGPSSFRRS